MNSQGRFQTPFTCLLADNSTALFLFSDMLALGKSKPWPEALKSFTGSSSISTDPIKEYFDPLIRWLKNYRQNEGYPVGWSTETKLQGLQSSQMAGNSRREGASKILFLVSLVFVYYLH